MILGVLPARFRELFNNRLSSTKGNCIACCFEKAKTSVTMWGQNKVMPCTGLTCIKAATVRPAASYFVLSKSSTLKRGASLLLKYFQCFLFAAPFPLFFFCLFLFCTFVSVFSFCLRLLWQWTNYPWIEALPDTRKGFVHLTFNSL